DRDLRIFRCGDAFERERNGVAPLDPLYRAPVEWGLKFVARSADPPRGHVALGDIAFAAAVDRGVDGEAEQGIGLRHRALDMVVYPGLVATHIELKHAHRLRRRLRHRFETGLAD